MDKKEKSTVSLFGLASEACRRVGVSRTVFETAKKKIKENEQLTRKELEVMLKYKELVREVEEQSKTI